MRLLQRSLVKIYYAYPTRGEPIYKDGLRTGEYSKGFSEPQELKVSLSSSNGQLARELFGDLLNYTYLLISEIKLKEGALIWIEKDPENYPNYEVIGRSESLNTNAYAIKRLNVVKN